LHAVARDPHVDQLQAAQPRHPHPGIQQQPEDDLVATAEEDAAVEHPGPAAGDCAGLEHGGDLVVGQDRDGPLRRRGLSGE
jgi:hypothetical protein